MNRKYLLKRIAQDCIPTVFSLLMSGLYGVMDGLFVGRAVGDAGLAAIMADCSGDHCSGNRNWQWGKCAVFQ